MAGGGDFRNRRNVLHHTFIGIDAEVVKSASRLLEGIRGTIVDETKNTLVLETKKGMKKIPKASCTFLFRLGSEDATVEGRKILFRPEERPKKVK